MWQYFLHELNNFCKSFWKIIFKSLEINSQRLNKNSIFRNYFLFKFHWLSALRSAHFSLNSLKTGKEISASENPIFFISRTNNKALPRLYKDWRIKSWKWRTFKWISRGFGGLYLMACVSKLWQNEVGNAHVRRCRSKASFWKLFLDSWNDFGVQWVCEKLTELNGNIEGLLKMGWKTYSCH